MSLPERIEPLIQWLEHHPSAMLWPDEVRELAECAKSMKAALDARAAELEAVKRERDRLLSLVRGYIRFAPSEGSRERHDAYHLLCDYLATTKVPT